MFLSIDVGNTQTTIGLFADDGTNLMGWRMPTLRTDTSDSLRSRLYGYLSMDGFSMTDVTDAAIASVVPVLSRAWMRCFQRMLGHDPLLIGSGTSCGMPMLLKNPARVGADRVANAIAAVRTYGAPVIVVDFGTATNIDVVDRDGAYRGGTIAPGIMLSADALFSRAAKLSSVPVEAPAHALGDSTETAVQSGLVIGAAAQAEGLVARIKAELAIDDATVVGTGGLARTVSVATDLFDAIDPDLTLRGIRDIWRWTREHEA
ncbi:MAG: type III pantothenate kinase [Atopobiaceae bacterium]|nr:type III pantothenate kinase [Atopobiaceae bacterium]MBR3161079.1 type III pantothenate kinase [Atopobiaceae bacterium]